MDLAQGVERTAWLVAEVLDASVVKSFPYEGALTALQVVYVA